MTAITTLALLLPALAILRGRTLLSFLGAASVAWLFGWLLWLRLPDVDPRLAFALLAVAEGTALAVLLAGGRDVRWSANRGALVAAIVYAAVIPSMLRVPIDGDEPYYLLITESIVRDFDLDLANQYGDTSGSDVGRDTLQPFPGDPTGPNGEQYSRHEPFLPLLMVPGYLAGGLAGSVAVIALFGALLVRSTLRWMEEEGIDERATRAVFPFFALAPPVLFYSTRIWPEVPAAFFFVESLRGLSAWRAKRWVPAMAGFVLLKLRFIPVAAALLAIFAFRRRREAGASIGRLVLAAAVLALPLAVAWIVTGDATNVHSLRDVVPGGPPDYLRGFAGLLADGMSGIAFQAPFYLLALAAVFAWRDVPGAFFTGLAASLPYLLLLAPRAEWFGGWAPPLRYVVFLTPVLALGAAAVWKRIPAGVVALVSAATAGLVVHGLTWPWRLFHIFNGENAAGEWLSARYDADFSRLFPSFVRLNEAAWIGGAAVLAIVVVLGMWARGERGEGETGRGEDGARGFSPVIPALAALAIALAFQAGRQPASRVDFEDAHVVHDGGSLWPDLYTMMRTAHRGGWVVEAGHSLSFLAREGQWTLHYVTGTGAMIQIADDAYHLEGGEGYRTFEVRVPAGGRTVLRCLSGSVNLDRMERHE